MVTLAMIVGLLVLPWLVVRVAGLRPATRRFAGLLGGCLVFFFAGVGHFVITDLMARMLPPWVPWRVALVLISGVAEILLALLLLVPGFRRPVGWCLIVMLVLFLPVNIYAAVERVPIGGHGGGPAYLWLRVPLQVLLAGWLYGFAVRSPPEGVACAPSRPSCSRGRLATERSDIGPP